MSPTTLAAAAPLPTADDAELNAEAAPTLPHLRLVSPRDTEPPAAEDAVTWSSTVVPLVPRVRRQVPAHVLALHPSAGVSLRALREAPELDDGFSAVRTPLDALPPVRARAAVLVRAIVEVLGGVRSAGQLVRCTSLEVQARLESLVHEGTSRPGAGGVRRVRVTEPAEGVAEVSAVVQRDGRVAALAMRLEGVDGRWRVTALEVG